ncbi:MAG: YfhO family protein [Bacteroidales bacterium]
MEKYSIKHIWPYLAAIVVFIILTVSYFSPILEGKRINQSDITHWRGMSQEIIEFREQTGQEPLWTNAMFGGMPAYQISTIYKGNLLGYVDDILQLGLPHPIGLVFLYFLGFFILMLVMRVNPWLSVLGAVGFAFSSYFFIILEAGHNSKAHAIGYMAPVLAGIILTYRGKYLWGAALTALFLGLELLSNHLQITYYLLMIVVIFGIAQLVESVRKKEMPHFFKATGVLVIAALLAVGTNISNLWATWEYGKYTIRGKTELTSEQENRTTGLDIDYATQWSYGVTETMSLLIPDFMGGGSGQNPSVNSNTYEELRQALPAQQAQQYLQFLPLYWGKQPFTSGPVYAGAIMVFLFVMGLFVVKGKLKWWLLSATVLGIMLAWGKNFMGLTEFFLHYVPGYNKFRAVSMIMVIAELTIPLLGIIALHRIFDKKTDRKEAISALKYSFFIAGGIALFFALVGGSLFNFSSPADRQLIQSGFPQEIVDALRHDRAAVLRADALRSFIFILLAGLVIWLAIVQKIKKQYTFLILIVLVLVDMWGVNRRYLNNEDFVAARKAENPYTVTAADQQILQDDDPNFRVLNLTVNTFNDASTSYFHKSIGGYHGAKLRRYQELIDHHISQNNMDVLNMLNTKYFIMQDQNNQPQARFNPDALGHAWIVDDFSLVENADEEIDALDNFDPAATAIIDNRFEEQLEGFMPGTDANAVIELTDYQPNKIEYRFRSEKEELVVFSEIYYDKGWNAYVDGEQMPYLRANYVLRAMVVPAGSHDIVWKFEPAVYHTGGKIALITSIIILLILFASLGNELKDKLAPTSKQ